MPVATSTIPFIDFSSFGDGTSEEAKEIGLKFYLACRDVGFAYIVGHGMPQKRIDETFAWSKKLFDLSHEEKMLAPHPPKGDQHRGYSGIGVEQVSQMVFDEDELAKIRQSSPDNKESFDMGVENSTYCPNLWLPEDTIPGFRAHAVSFFDECTQLQKKVLHALALGLPGVQPDFFEAFHDEGDHQLRLLHYPSAPAKSFEDKSKTSLGAHSDFGTCTLLFQDGAGGLEVEDPHQPGVFMPAPPIEGAIVFNIGDFLQRWSNDTLKSTLHRVRAPEIDPADPTRTLERYSIPFFCSANPDALIDTLPGSYSAENPKKYSPVTSGEYISMRLNATYVETR